MVEQAPDGDRPGRGRLPGDGHLERVLPPGQQRRECLPVMHYGPVPKARSSDSWWMRFWGRTSCDTGAVRDLSLAEAHTLTLGELDTVPRSQVLADLHCGQGWSVLDNTWEGVAAREVIDRFPPADDVTHVLVYAEYGYSATIGLEDLASPRTLLATHLDGQVLTPEHGHPVRLVVPHLYSWKGPKWFRGWEYLTAPRRGFWEERGYHLHGECWNQERYSYQEP